MLQLMPTIAIIGSGPAGCYSAQFLKKGLPGAEITVFEALPVPYGLLRYGVAPDHQGTKNISSQFERMFTTSNVRFVGNVEIGKDIPLTELIDAFDVVVVATGLYVDRKLGIPGDSLSYVCGAGEILRSLNGYPQSDSNGMGHRLQALGERIAVIGNGNVAMDVVRLIAKSEEELAGSDINDIARKNLCTDKVRCIDVIGRSPIEQAKFDLAMLREICQLKNATIRWPDKHDGSHGLAADLLSSTDEASVGKKGSLEINFRFNSNPLLITARNMSAVLTLNNKSVGSIQDYHYDTIITAVGFCHNPEGSFASVAGVYSVGWARRGPTGTVAANRREAAEVSATILKDLECGRIATGKAGLKTVEDKIMHKAVTFEQWQCLDRYEINSAPSGRCRKKAISIAEMLSVMETGTSLP